jgi:hypothetical protein
MNIEIRSGSKTLDQSNGAGGGLRTFHSRLLDAYSADHEHRFW